jgi:tetratricopeptide (TPR) repeat protein
VSFNAAVSLNNLALLYQNIGECAKAEPLYQEALRIRRKVLGSEHPDTALSLNNLAVLYQSMERTKRDRSDKKESERRREWNWDRGRKKF